MLAGLGYQPYQGNDVADFTPQQKAAMGMADTAAGAFGFDQAGYGGPTGATVGPNGIPGFSTFDVMKEQQPNYNELQSFLDKFAQQASRAPKVAKKKSGGGKK
jgi:hypothetical protein